MKGFAAICVVLGHVVNGYIAGNTYPQANGFMSVLLNLTYAFHMPLFMTISGYVYGKAYRGDDGAIRMRRQLADNLAVYCLFSVALGATKYFFARYANGSITLSEIPMIWAKPISPYWYLYDLMIFYLLFSLRGIRKANPKILLSALFGISLVSGFIRCDWFDLERLLRFAFFFFAGFVYQRHIGKPIGKRLALIGFFLTVLSGFLSWRSISEGAARRVDELLVLNVIIAIGACLLLWFLFQNHTFFSENRFLTLVGRHGLEVYVLHCFFTAGFRAVFPRLGISNAYVSVGLNAILSTLIPLLFALFCAGLGIHDCFFKPVSWVKKMKCSVSKTV